MHKMRQVPWLLILMLGGLAAAAEPAGDAALADALFQQGNTLQALPLYERLAAADAGSALYAERLASCIYAQMELLPAGQQREAQITRALREAQRASQLGDSSNFLAIMLARLQGDAVHAPTDEEQQLRAAETAFNKGDLDAALAGYEAVALRNPRSYLAHLFAGDVHFRRRNLPLAAEWFGRAIAIDPDKETAHRYWADAIAGSGDEAGALGHYIDAVVAEPYQRTAWMGLQQWAGRNGLKLQAPRLPAPQVTITEGAGKDAKITVNMDPSLLADKAIGATWLAYALVRTSWMKGVFLERNPEATAYRHSLQEEVAALRAALEVAQRDNKDASAAPAAIRDLLRLGQDGLLEAYVLVSAADDGISRDYAAYRAGHREQLAAYMDKYVVARPQPAN